MSQEPNGYLRRNSLISIGIGVAGIIIPTVVVMLTGLIWLVQETTSLSTKINSLELSATKSIDERNFLMKQAEENRISCAELKERLSNERTERTEAMKEIETQFSSLHESTNVAHAELHRMNAVAWLHIPGLGPYPSGPYTFSNISNRK